MFFGIVSNTAPWTYLGKRAVHTNPQAGFDSGLDVFALRSMHTLGTFLTLRQMLSGDGLSQPRGNGILTLHDEAELTMRSDRPVALPGRRRVRRRAGDRAGSARSPAPCG